MFRGSVKITGYPLHSPVPPSLPLLCVTVCHHISSGLYSVHRICDAVSYVLSTNAGRSNRPFALTQNKAWDVTLELAMTVSLNIFPTSPFTMAIPLTPGNLSSWCGCLNKSCKIRDYKKIKVKVVSLQAIRHVRGVEVQFHLFFFMFC